MPPLSKSDKKDWIVYYEKIGETMLGVPRLDSPVDMKVRWIEGKVDVLDPLGNKIQVDSMIETSSDVVIGSVVKRGRIADTVGTGTALDDVDTYQIASVNKVSDLSKKDYYRSYGLIKYGSRVP